MKFLTGKQSKPRKTLIYGAEFTGKSHLAANAPGVFFIDIEDGSERF